VCEVLLAEDNPADVKLLRIAFEEHQVDCTLQVASDGQQVLKIIAAGEGDPAQKRPDLIVLDINLPRHDGIEILQRLQETHRWSRVPVVVLTTSDSPRDRTMALRLGAARFLRKPSNLDQFLALGAVVRDLLEEGRQRNGKSAAQEY
jgi:DNA-binding response OmpR family regulator